MLVAEDVCGTLKTGSSQLRQPAPAYFVSKAVLGYWKPPGLCPAKTTSAWEFTPPGRQFLTSAEGCRGINTPAPVSPDWDNSGVTYAIFKDPSLRRLDIESLLGFLFFPSHATTPYSFFPGNSFS